MLTTTYAWQDLIVLVVILASALSQPMNNTTGEDCTENNDCTEGKICVDLRCVDPCRGVCGINSLCIVQDLTPVCSCKEGFFGDPFIKCNAAELGECTNDAQCSADKACIGQRCEDPCQGGCGLNTECRVVDHRPRCACLKGFVYRPPYGCKPTAVPECSSNMHCAEDRACRQQRCVDPCEEGVCGNNTVCNVRNHYPVCACQVGFLGDAMHECVPFCKDVFMKNVTNTKPLQERKKKSFIFHKNPKSWLAAFEDCYSRGMSLATVYSTEEWEELQASVPTPLDSAEFWLGGHDLGDYQHFVWVTSGKAITYSNWADSEPLGVDYHCLNVIGTIWRSYRCSYEYPYICESQ